MEEKKRGKGLLLPLLSLLLLTAALLLLRGWYHRAASVQASGAAETVLRTQTETPEINGPIDLNRATLGELVHLPGIGEVLARRILDYREEHNGFRSVEELTQVSGIGRKKLDRIREFIYLEESANENTGSGR